MTYKIRQIFIYLGQELLTLNKSYQHFIDELSTRECTINKLQFAIKRKDRMARD